MARKKCGNGEDHVEGWYDEEAHREKLDPFEVPQAPKKHLKPVNIQINFESLASSPLSLASSIALWNEHQSYEIHSTTEGKRMCKIFSSLSLSSKVRNASVLNQSWPDLWRYWKKGPRIRMGPFFQYFCACATFTSLSLSSGAMQMFIYHLYLTRVGLISGGIGRRGPESGWAPGGGAGGRGGSVLRVRRSKLEIRRRRKIG